MYALYPVLIVGAIIGVFATIFIVAFATMKDKKEAIGFDRDIKDSVIPFYLIFLKIGVTFS